MKNHVKLLVILVFFFLSAVAFARKVVPETPAPVVRDGVEYSVSTKNGFLQARDLKTGKIVWDSELFRVEYAPEYEADVQSVHIVSVVLEEGRLLAIDQRNQKYYLNLETGEGVAVDGSPLPVLYRTDLDNFSSQAPEE